MARGFAGASRFAILVGGTLLLGTLMTASGSPALAQTKGDPLVGYHVQMEVEGTLSGYFTEVDGIGSETETAEQKIIDKTGGEIIRKIPGRLKFLDVTLKRGITTNGDIWDWRAMVEDGNMTAARKNVTITLFDQTLAPIVSWTLLNAWPSKIVAPGLLTANGGSAVEELTIVNEGYTRNP